VWAIASAIRDVWSGSWDRNAAAIVDQYSSFIRRIGSLNIDVDAAPILDVSCVLSPLIEGKRDSKVVADQTVASALADTHRCEYMAVG
jgi:hypothetical protein